MSESTQDRTQPHSLEAEKAVLGALLIGDDAWASVAAVLGADDFYRDAHRRLFRAICGLVAAGKPIDFVLVCEALRAAGDLDEVGGPAYIAALTDGVPHVSNVTEYAGIVKEQSRLRQAIAASTAIASDAYAADRAAVMVVDDGVRRLLALAGGSGNGFQMLGAAAQEYIRSLDATAVAGLKTGFTDLDAQFAGGLEPPQLVIVAARPGAGKTTWAFNFAANLARAGIASGFFSLEMGSRALASRSLAMAASLDSRQLRAGMLGEREWARLSQALSDMHDWPIYLVGGTYTLTEVHAWSRRLRDEHGAKVIIIDYIQLMADARSRDRQQEMSAISRGLKRIAEELGLIVVGLSQLNRAPEHRSDKRPHLSDLRESGALEQDADVVLLLFRQDMYSDDDATRGIAEVIVAKNRLGLTGTVRLVFLAEQGRFQNLAWDQSPKGG